MYRLLNRICQQPQRISIACFTLNQVISAFTHAIEIKSKHFMFQFQMAPTVFYLRCLLVLFVGLGKNFVSLISISKCNQCANVLAISI